MTGSHAFKTGLQLMHGWRDAYFFMDPARNYSSYRLQRGVPTTVNYYAGPIGDKGRQRTLGVFAQDQWTLDRLTLNLGLRYDHLNGHVPARGRSRRHVGAGAQLPGGQRRPELEGCGTRASARPTICSAPAGPR